jgi:YfiH family protein
MSVQTAAALAAALRAARLDWILPDWPAPAHVCALATTRSGGVSTGPYATMNLGRGGGDDASRVTENRRRFERFLPSAPVALAQVHGAGVATMTRATTSSPTADAAVTHEAGVVCSVLTADCLPVLLTDQAGSTVGVAHAGWRGLAAGVLEASVDALVRLGAERGKLLAWLGPAIGPAAFEVGADVHAAFCATDPGASAFFAAGRPGKWHADLYGLARRRLARAGVASAHGGGYCTYTDTARFFSYRRERDSGRMATAVWLAPRGDGDRASRLV